MPVQASAGHFHSEELEFDPEWCAVLTRTHSLLQTRRGDVHLPQQVEKMNHQVGVFSVVFVRVLFSVCCNARDLIFLVANCFRP